LSRKEWKEWIVLSRNEVAYHVLHQPDWFPAREGMVSIVRPKQMHNFEEL